MHCWACRLAHLLQAARDVSSFMKHAKDHWRLCRAVDDPITPFLNPAPAGAGKAGVGAWDRQPGFWGTLDSRRRPLNGSEQASRGF